MVKSFRFAFKSNGGFEDPQSLECACALAQKARALCYTLPFDDAVLAEVYLMKREREKVIDAHKKAIALSPDDADGIAGPGIVWPGLETRGNYWVGKESDAP